MLIFSMDYLNKRAGIQKVFIAGADLGYFLNEAFKSENFFSKENIFTV